MKDFIPYEQAFALKELGFDEPCLAYWNFYTRELNYNGQPSIFSNEDVIQLPTFSQTFDWFEKTHSIFVQRMIDTNVNEIMDITYTIKSWKFPPIEIKFENPYDCFDKNKSELACLKELIELVKQKQ